MNGPARVLLSAALLALCAAPARAQFRPGATGAAQAGRGFAGPGLGAPSGQDFSLNPAGSPAAVNLEIPALDRPGSPAQNGAAAAAPVSAAGVPMAAPRAQDVSLPPSALRQDPEAGWTGTQTDPFAPADPFALPGEPSPAARQERREERAARTASAARSALGGRARVPDSLLAFSDRMSRAAATDREEAAGRTSEIWDGAGRRPDAVDARAARGDSLLSGRLAPPAPAGSRRPELLALNVSAPDLSVAVELARPGKDLRLAAFGVLLLPLAGLAFRPD